MRVLVVVMAMAAGGCAGPDVSGMGPFECTSGPLLPGDSYLVSWECGAADCAPSPWTARDSMDVVERDGELVVVFNDATEVAAAKAHIFPDLPAFYCLVTEAGLTMCPSADFVEGTVTDADTGDTWLMRGCLL